MRERIGREARGARKKAKSRRQKVRDEDFCLREVGLVDAEERGASLGCVTAVDAYLV
ncbi:MAG: hypothetical protein MZV64_19480 [Ignavibacteriales bacterium]|nr:hypothetical protein [Ignavibacteriales bacterium]